MDAFLRHLLLVIKGGAWNLIGSPKKYANELFFEGSKACQLNPNRLFSSEIVSDFLAVNDPKSFIKSVLCLSVIYKFGEEKLFHISTNVVARGIKSFKISEQSASLRIDLFGNLSEQEHENNVLILP